MFHKREWTIDQMKELVHLNWTLKQLQEPFFVNFGIPFGQKTTFPRRLACAFVL